MVQVNLYIFNKRLWNASTKLTTAVPPLHHTLVVGPSAPPGELEQAMAAVGYDGKDENADLNAVAAMTFCLERCFH